MNDYHDHNTIYTYTDTNRVSTIAAPGTNNVWTYTYNALGQPTNITRTNGLTAAYSYDGRNALTKIEHKDGVTVKQSFTYALDDVGNITTTTHDDEDK